MSVDASDFDTCCCCEYPTINHQTCKECGTTYCDMCFEANKDEPEICSTCYADKE